MGKGRGVSKKATKEIYIERELKRHINRVELI